MYPGQPGEPVEEQFPRFEPHGDDAYRQARPVGTQPYRGGGQANPWLVGLALAAVLIAVSVISFGLFGADDGAAPTTTAPGAGTTAPTETTAPGDTTDTTGSPADITLPTLPPSGEIVAVGDPIPIGDLLMSSNDIGPLDFGDDGDEVLGRLASTFGAPSQDTGFIIGDGAFGECPGDSIRVVQWGPLNVVMKGNAASSQFVSYRMDLRYGNLTSPTRDVATLSGLRVGDRVSQLESTYRNFVIDYVVDPQAGLVFQLYTQRGGDLLLWGPVDGRDEDSLVTGIYSPDSCGR